MPGFKIVYLISSLKHWFFNCSVSFLKCLVLGSLTILDIWSTDFPTVHMQRFKGKVSGIKVQVVDTTGAGDAFCAGLLSSLVKDFGIIEVSSWLPNLHSFQLLILLLFSYKLAYGCENLYPVLWFQSMLEISQDEARLREALRFANACGAITTTERGAIPSMPDRDTVLRMISEVITFYLLNLPVFLTIVEIVHNEDIIFF